MRARASCRLLLEPLAFQSELLKKMTFFGHKKCAHLLSAYSLSRRYGVLWISIATAFWGYWCIVKSIGPTLCPLNALRCPRILCSQVQPFSRNNCSGMYLTLRPPPNLHPNTHMRRSISHTHQRQFVTRALCPTAGVPFARSWKVF